MISLGRVFKFFKKDKIKGDYLLALDIGTTFAKALIFKINKETKKGIVLGVGYERQGMGNMQAGAVADISAVVEVCQKAIKKAKVMAGEINNVSQAVLGVAGEFIKGSVTTLNYERENFKQRINLVELKNIIQKIQWRALNKIRQDVAEETGVSGIEIKLINAVIVDVKIDGYKITNPLSFQGKEISLSIFNAYAPLVHLGALQSIVRALELDLLFIAAEPYAIARSVKINNQSGESLDDKKEAIFIDLGGGTTDIALVRQGGIEGIKSLALGGKAFTKRLAQTFDLGLQEAEEIKLKYSRDEVSPLVKRKISGLFKQDIQIWLSGVSLALEEFSQVSPLPNNILLCGGGSLLPGIKKSLESQSWPNKISLPRKPNARFIQPSDVIDIQDKTGQLTKPSDVTPLALASLSFDLLKEEDRLLSLNLKRAIKLLQS